MPTKEYYEANKDLERERARKYQRQLRISDPDYDRKKDYVRKYGITFDEYNEKWNEQKGLCAICNQPETRIIKGKVARLVVDHEHGAKARKLLCSNCNILLGMARESIEILEKAILYIKEHVKR